MPTGVKLASQHLVLMKLTITLMRAASTEYFGNEKAASICDAVLLVMAVAIGQLERNPMSASKIAQFVGMPRVTALRKLNELHVRGFVERPTKSKYTLPLREFNKPAIIRAVAALARSVHRASTELSKLDTT